MNTPTRRINMVLYSTLSNQLYKENFSEGQVNFIGSPTTVFSDELRVQVFASIKKQIENSNFRKFLDYLEGSAYCDKYLFILGLVFCIPNDETERTDKSYWRNFSQNISDEKQSSTPRRMLAIVSKFCKKHSIPFFDVYQNDNHVNFCSRIYSLMPFEYSEVQAVAYIYLQEEIDLNANFALLKELVLTTYSPLFRRSTLQALRNGDEELQGFINEDIIPLEPFNYRKIFAAYIERYWNKIKNVPIFEEKQKLDEKRKLGATRTIGLKDFKVYFKSNSSAGIDQLFFRPRGSLLGEVEFDKMPLSQIDFAGRLKIDFNYLGSKRTLPLAWEKKYVVTRKVEDNGWFELEVEKAARVYKNDIAGFCEIVNGKLEFVKCDFDSIPIAIKNRYLNVHGSTSIEFSGGLAYYNERYMWFAIPDIVVHNEDLDRVKMKLDNNAISINGGKSLKEKFYRYIENKKQVGVFPLENPPNGDYSILSFYDRSDLFLASIKVERQNYRVGKESLPLAISNCPIERKVATPMPAVKFDPIAFNYANKGEFLLFWLSRFEGRGVSYERFKNAIISLYFGGPIAFNQLVRNLTTIAKRIIEQFIGLGFISTGEANDETKFVIDKSRFIITHNGQLLYTGARSFQDLKDILNRDAGQVLTIDVPFALFGCIDMPSLIKYNTNHSSLIAIDQNEVLKRFVKDTLVIDKQSVNQSTIESYPLYLLATYQHSKEKMVCSNGTLFSKIDGLEVFDHSDLTFRPVDTIESVHPGHLLQTTEYGTRQRYLAGELHKRDGELAIELFKVFTSKFDDALYYCEVNKPSRYLGWIYCEEKHVLYIPRKINIPHQLRQALQCCVGSYSTTYFVKPLTKNSALPLINRGNVMLFQNMEAGLIEIEAFLGITTRFLSAIENKLNIQTKKAVVQCNHR